MDQQNALKPLSDSSAESLQNALTLWATTTSDSTSPRFKDMVRNKKSAVNDFFSKTQKLANLITPLDVQAWREQLEASGLKPTTVYARLSFLSSFYNWAMSDPTLSIFIKTNPVTLARPKAPKGYQTESSKSLTDQQLEALVTYIKSQANTGAGTLTAKRDYALLLIYLLSGMRRAEIISLRGSQVEFTEEGMILSTKVKGGDYLGRMISEPAAQEALLSYLNASQRTNVIGSERPLWTRHDRAGKPGAPMSSYAFVKQMKRYAREAGLKHFHLHQTRHTFARIVAESSGSLEETRDALGHKNISTTRIYVQRIIVKRDKYSSEIAKRMKL